jgi:hypothetical protein
MRTNVAAVCLDDFARDRASDQIVVDDRIIGLGEAQLQRVAIECAQALDRMVIIELGAGLPGRVDRSALRRPDR